MIDGCSRQNRLGGFAAVFAMLVTMPPAAAGTVSRYTTHDFATCPARRSSEPGVVEVTACAGLGGLPVVWTSEPDASSVTLGIEVGARPLDLGSFFEVQPVIEWRGLASAGRFSPRAAIVRYRTGPSIGHLSMSRLLVYRIEGRRSCLIGSVMEPHGNERARALADRAAVTGHCPPKPA